EQFFRPPVRSKLADQLALLRVAAKLFEMGLHVFHDPVLIKLARGVSSKVNLRFQKRARGSKKDLAKITQAFAGQSRERGEIRSLPAHHHRLSRGSLLRAVPQ